MLLASLQTGILPLHRPFGQKPAITPHTLIEERKPMLRPSVVAVGKFCLLWLLFSLVANFTWAQSETATVSGQVVDPSGLNITGAQVRLVDIDRDTSASVPTNNTGLYAFPIVRPGRYRMELTAAGFKVVNVTGLIVNVQDHIEQNFRLQIGSVAESVTVTAGAPLVNTTDGTVSTVVDRQFAENLPMNGRSFQTLIDLTPGVVLTTSDVNDSGQFSVNGQRASSNYWMVDGVSANIGVSTSATPGNGLAGALGSFSAQGGTNSLVSVDALQEFRIQTSSFAPEFGRTPGAQISIVTRSGTNQFHGTFFDYFRNDVLDANDWFNGYTNAPSLPKAKERQNDFGATFSGPILRDRTFFFFSYEGLRLRLPQTVLTTVPDLNARETAARSMQPFLNAYPFDPKQPNLGNGIAQFNASYSDASSLDAYSMRIDHHVSDRFTVFGRYNYSPSELLSRGANSSPLSSIEHVRITTETATAGATWALSPNIVDDLRLNYSRVDGSSYWTLDTFGGAVPLSSEPYPKPYTDQDAQFNLYIASLTNSYLAVGQNQANIQRQINVTDNISLQKGSHGLKFGIDVRRLSPIVDPLSYNQLAWFNDVPSAESGNLTFAYIQSSNKVVFLFQNVGAYAQDTWRVGAHLTLTYGLRWDVDFAPSTTSGPNFPAITGYSSTNLSSVALAPSGTPPFRTPYRNLAPRMGVAYQVAGKPDWQTVLRGGFGVFFDLATSEAGNVYLPETYPFGAYNYLSGTFPLSSTQADPPPITSANLNSQLIQAFDPHLGLPYTLQWNTSIQQGIGGEQTLSVSYIGALGRRLLQAALVSAPNPNFEEIYLVGNTATSDYEAFQLQFQRRLSHGLQALVSYTLSHSIDDASGGSTGSSGNYSNVLLPGSSPNVDRGPSSFDVRNALSAGVTYDVPAPKIGRAATAVLGGWSIQSMIQARSALPVNVSYNPFVYTIGGAFVAVRPDVAAGVPLYLYGPQFPGGKALNNIPALGGPNCIGPFCPPPLDPVTNEPTQQGNLGRNALRGFGASQWDFAIHRELPVRESVKLQFRAEVFNILNHPNFGAPVGDLTNPQFGLSTQMLGQSLGGGNVGGGGLSPLYQIGGPRSIQLALKLTF
jgi:hypothetical protein